MNRRVAALIFTVAAAVGCDAPTSPGEEHMQALAEAERWVSAHPTGWTVQVASGEAPRRESWSTACSSTMTGLAAVSVRATRTRLTAYFSCANGAPDNAASMRTALRFVVIEELPHGIRVPNWTFRVMTPSSSITSGIDIREAANGRVVFAVNTNLFAAYGHSDRKSCQPPADGPSEPQCFVQREHRIPLTLEMLVPLDGAIFK